MTIFAAIDIGTNSVRLLVVEKEGASLIPIYKDLLTTRIGEGLALTGYLKPQAMERTAQAVQKFITAARENNAHQPFIFATSAVRDASNKDEFVRMLKDKIGKHIEIITGEEEARLSFLGASFTLPEDKRDDLVVIDIGGGSTEIIFRKEKLVGVSIPIGAVKLFDNPLNSTQLKKLFQEAISCIPYKNPRLVGVGGTITSMAAVLQELAVYDTEKVHGYQMQTIEVRKLTKKLHELTLAERKCLPGLQPERADIIPFGADILLNLLELINVNEITVSESDILEGRILMAKQLKSKNIKHSL